MHLLTSLFSALFLLTTVTVATAQKSVTFSGDTGPAVLFDGEEITQEELAALKPEQMGDITVLLGDKAFAKYGKYAEHGGVVVTSPATAAAAQAAATQAVIEAAAPKPAGGTVKAQLPDASYYEIDGRPATAEDVRALDPSKILSVQQFKGSEAEIRFGPSAKDGAVSVITKG